MMDVLLDMNTQNAILQWFPLFPAKVPEDVFKLKTLLKGSRISPLDVLALKKQMQRQVIVAPTTKAITQTQGPAVDDACCHHEERISTDKTTTRALDLTEALTPEQQKIFDAVLAIAYAGLTLSRLPGSEDPTITTLTVGERLDRFADMRIIHEINKKTLAASDDVATCARRLAAKEKRVRGKGSRFRKEVVGLGAMCIGKWTRSGNSRREKDHGFT